MDAKTLSTAPSAVWRNLLGEMTYSVYNQETILVRKGAHIFEISLDKVCSGKLPQGVTIRKAHVRPASCFRDELMSNQELMLYYDTSCIYIWSQQSCQTITIDFLEVERHNAVAA